MRCRCVEAAPRSKSASSRVRHRRLRHWEQPGRRSQNDGTVCAGARQKQLAMTATYPDKKATPRAPQATEKEMPEYTMEARELVYPGEGSPFRATDPKGATVERPVSHPAHPPTEQPQHRAHGNATMAVGLLKSLTECATACERCHEECRAMPSMQNCAEAAVTSQACADICILLHGYVSGMHQDGLMDMALDLAPVCARVCEACALACSKLPEMAACVTCERACRNCAQQCRSFAQ